MCRSKKNYALGNLKKMFFPYLLSKYFGQYFFPNKYQIYFGKKRIIDIFIFKCYYTLQKKL